MNPISLYLRLVRIAIKARMQYRADFVTGILGVIVILVPRLPVLKEWAYAGFVFIMTGALFSHFAVGDAAKEYFGPSLLLALTAVSWYCRPGSRKLVAIP